MTPDPLSDEYQLRPILWGDAFLMGNPRIDREHRGFVDIVNELQSAIRTGLPAGVIVAVCENLAEDVARHFRTEEAEMSEHGFPALDAHRQEHAEVLDFVRAEVARIHGATERSDLLQGAIELKARLLEHLFRFDASYKSFFQTHAGR